MFYLTSTSHSEPCQSGLISAITLTCVTLSSQQLTLGECPSLWETTSPMHTYRKKFESLNMQGKDFMVAITPLVGVFAVAMVLRIPRESQ